MKKFIGSVVPFLFFHLICCGGIIIFLATSGYLLLIRQEGDKKIYLIPLLLMGALSFFIYNRYTKHCDRKGCKTILDWLILIAFYTTFSVIFGLAFMIYIFIPWWIPGYRGGLLLP